LRTPTLLFSRPRGQGLRGALLCAALILCAACLTPADRADRAYTSGQFDEALALYEEEISAGSKDPELFYKAGRTALKLGNFASAERYYSRSLRYGGGLTAANALAELYLQSSNYTRAIQVLKFLLNASPEDPQPIYNNLGTALMYANEPLDAESYLLVAQQLDPRDPIPYVNLGILYDRHLRQPFVAVEFYECYTSLAGQDTDQGRSIAMRIQELRNQYPPRPKPLLTCGQPYSPDESMTLGDARAALRESPAGPVQVIPPDEADPKGGPIVVESGGTASPAEQSVVKPPDKSPDKAAKDPELATREQARDHQRAGRHTQSIAALESLPAARLSADDARMLATSYLELGQPERAELWARWAYDRDPDLASTDLLLRVLTRLGRADEINKLCAKIAEQTTMRPATRHCTQPVQKL
jgi:tetratricopeptide (TPR) repeat protein